MIVFQIAAGVIAIILAAGVLDAVLDWWITR
jgi:hypothetical protein